MDQAPKDTKSVEVKKKKKNSFGRFVASIFFSLLFVTVLVGGIIGYFYKDDLRRELCQRDFTQFVLDKTNISKCQNIDEEKDDNNSTFEIKTSESSDDDFSGEAVDITEIFEKANPSVVAVGIKTDTTDASDTVIGSGFVISPDGLIATNQHVVSETDTEYYIKFPNEQDIVDVTEIFRDEVNDIAILKVDRKDLPSLTLGQSDDLEPGEPVVAIGNPLGELNSTVTSGIVSGLHRTVEVNNGSFLRTDFKRYEDTIQTDAAINPGNSGGPLLNAKAEVIGINFATITTADNLSFAIPVDYLKTRVAEINEFGKFRIPYIGVEYTSELVTVKDKVYVGARVVSFDPEGSAKDVLEEGDIIIEIDGESLEENSLAALIQKLNIGDFIDIDVVRDGRIVTETVEIIERQ